MERKQLEPEEQEAEEIPKTKKQQGENDFVNKVYFRCSSFELELQSTSEDILSLLVHAELLKNKMLNSKKAGEKSYYG